MTEVPRDRWSRPLITPPDDGKPQPYKRASSLGGILEDKYHLNLYYQRMVAEGIAGNPHLSLLVAAAKGDKGKLNKITEEAIESAGGGRKSSIGTALHSLTEQVDRGEELSDSIPDEYVADIEAYKAATADIEWLAIEQFVVCDELGVAGTPDRIGRLLKPLSFSNGVTLPAGWTGVFDLKTGGVGFPHGFSVQLATYAHSEAYDPDTGERTPLPEGLDQDHAVLIHLPAGEGKCELHLLDIASGWQAAKLALEVDRWRKQKSLTAHIVTTEEVA